MERNWIVRTCISLLLVLVLPFELRISSEGLMYASLLVQFGGISYYIEMLSNTEYFTGILILFIICMPLIYFNYKLYTKPREASLKKSLVPAVVFSQPIMMYFMIIPLLIIGPVIQGTPLYSLTMLVVPAILAINWAYLILVVFPYLHRQADLSNLSKSNNEIHSILGMLRKPTKTEIISFFFVFCIMFIPTYSIQQYLYIDYAIYGLYDLTYISPIGMVNIYVYNTGYLEFATVSTLYYSSMGLVTVGSIWWASSILEYLQGKKKRRICIRNGLISLIILLFAPYIPNPLSGPMMYNATPLPVMIVVGFLTILFVKPTKIKEEIWDEADHKMWFDTSISEKGSDDYQTVKVPLAYIIRSRLTRSKSKTARYDWDKKDVFDKDMTKEKQHEAMPHASSLDE